MSIIGSNILAGASGQAGGGYEIERSVRFNSSDSAYLSRTPASSSNRKTWTWAGWVKRAYLGSNSKALFSASASGADYVDLRFESDGLRADFEASGQTRSQVLTTAIFRDPSAWYHIVLAVDSTQATAADRVKIYVNGVAQSTSNTINQNIDFAVNSTSAHNIGRRVNGSDHYFDGLLAECYLLDGIAADPTSFGEYDTNGVWQPIDASGLTFGTNGFHLPFSDNSTAAALGTDSSSNGNTWTVNNISVITGGPTSVAAASGALPVFNTTDTYGAVKGTGTRTDTNSASIVLALPMDGTNGGTSFGDQSAVIKGSGSAKTVTVNGNTNTSTTQSKFYGSSGYFDGSGDYLTGGTSSDYIFGTGDFTVECWAYFNVLNGENALVSIHNNNSNWVWKVVSAKLQFYNGSTSNTGTSTITAGSWYHFAVTRQSSSLKLWVNGVNEHTATVSNNYTINNTLHIGAQENNLAGTYLNGYLQDVRLYKGVAKYTGNFNPPSSTANATIAAGNDSLVDSPTNGSQVDTGAGGEVRGNYCTWNPLQSSAATLANGNLDCTTAVVTGAQTRGTIAVSTGKWYWEVLVNTTVGANNIGIIKTSEALAADRPGYFAGGYAYVGFSGNKENNASASSYGATYGSGDVIGVALDLDAGTLVFYKNGASQGTAFSSLSGEFIPAIGDGTGGSGMDISANFGQRQWAYAAPAGFKALCTQNLPEGTITTSGTFTGNASADGPFVYLNGVPTAMTINSNAVTFATHADKLSNGFKLRTSSGSYNTAGSNTYSITTTGAKFKFARAQPNP